MQSLPSVKEGGSRGSSSLELVKCSRHRPKGPRTAGTENPQVKVNGPILNARHFAQNSARDPAGFRPNQHSGQMRLPSGPVRKTTRLTVYAGSHACAPNST